MKIKQLLETISSIAIKNQLSTPYVVGGVPRDKVLHRVNEIADIDITTGDDTVHAFASELVKIIPTAKVKTFPDQHSQAIVDGVKIDFSSNFRVPGVQQMLQHAGLSNPSNMQCELYSRDFTCNTLLLSMDLKYILDPTGLGIRDINDKVIRTCLPAQLTLGSQPKRVIRAIYLAVKLGFELDDEIVQWVRKYPESIAAANSKTISEKLNKSIAIDKEKTMALIDNLGVRKHIPMTPSLIKYFATGI